MIHWYRCLTQGTKGLQEDYKDRSYLIHLRIMSEAFKFKIGSSPQPKLAFTNRIYVSRNAFNMLGITARQLGVKISKSDPAVNVTIGHWIFLARLERSCVATGKRE